MPTDAMLPENAMPAGLTIQQVQIAVERSGYPLQTTVGQALADKFQLQPEWGFLDRNSGDMRAIDLLASRPLYPIDGEQPRVAPSLTVLIECKRSEMPFVFFESHAAAYGTFPHVAGLRSELLNIKTDDDRSSWSVPHLFALSLYEHPFISSPPATCSTVTKVARKGKEIELTGTDAYQGLVLPIRSAIEHFRATAKPLPTFAYFQAFLVLGLAVIDAPMVAARMNENGETTLEHINWQRLWRHEPIQESWRAHEGESTAIDIVHRSFLTTYMDDHLLPFAEAFGERVLRHGTELASGEGFARGMGANSYEDVEPRLRPRSGARIRTRPRRSREAG